MRSDQILVQCRSQTTEIVWRTGVLDLDLLFYSEVQTGRTDGSDLTTNYLQISLSLYCLITVLPILLLATAYCLLIKFFYRKRRNNKIKNHKIN